MHAGWRTDDAGGAAVIRDVDEARVIGSDLFYPHKLMVLDRQRYFAMSVQAGRVGPAIVGDLTYSSDVRIDCGELGTSYHVSLPVHGYIETRHGRVSMVATPDRAAVYKPSGDTSLTRWAANCRLLAVKIDKVALERTFADLIGRDIRAPIAFDADFDLRTNAARSWVELVRLVSGQLQVPGSLIHQPLVNASLVRGLLMGLATISRHPYRSLLDEPTDACRPSLINRAVEFTHEHLHEPITTVDVAKHCCVSVRALQEGFQRHLGQPPMRYVHAIRLERAHDDLIAANPFDTTVQAIAHRWGFTHLSRFAAVYQERYGQPPSHTLRSGS